MAKIKKPEPITDREVEEQIRKSSEDLRSEKLVPIRLAKDPMNENGVQFVSLNGYAYRIPLGVTVPVPRSVEKLLEDANLL